MSRRNTGVWGEDTAAGYLTEHGYTITARNYHTRYGEIDIIAAYDRCICFVEVRTRTEGAMVSGIESIDIRKMRKVFRSACQWLAEHPCDLQPRFDVIEITASKQRAETLEKLTHITNAFGAEVCDEIF